MEEAPVICVSPMDFGNCVRLVARNLPEFFALNFFHRSAILNDFDTEKDYLSHKKHEEEDQSAEYFNHQLYWKERRLAATLAKEKFQLPDIANPILYMHELRAERLRKVVIKTRDELGIVPFSEGMKRTGDSYHCSRVEFPISDVGKLQLFLSNADTETKLAIVRDLQEQYMNDFQVVNLLCRELEVLGMPIEAKKLHECMGV